MVGESPAPNFHHTPVMLAEVVALVAPVPPGVFVDATVGGGSHSQAILENYPHLEVLGIDRDPMALEAAASRLEAYGSRVRLVRARFDEIESVLGNAGLSEISGFLFDLGVSSPQLDMGERGFSFRNDGPLDMRMDPDSPLSADEIVNNWAIGDIADVLRRNADERFAGRIARAIVSARPIEGTVHLGEIVASAIPAAARRTGGHPAKRTFQALRIAVNSELEILRPAVSDALAALAPSGRGLVLTYHSGEDRIIKDLFRIATTSNTPPGLPLEIDPKPFSLVRPPARKPGAAEIELNRRASSARLRVIERVVA